MRTILFAIFIIAALMPTAYAKDKREQHEGDLLALKTPGMLHQYEAILFFDNHTAAVIASPSDDEPFPCESTPCVIANMAMKNLTARCLSEKYCAYSRPISYEIGQSKCQSRQEMCTSLGIQFSPGVTLWLVPPAIVPTSALAERISHTLSPEAPSERTNLPSTATEWVAYVNSINDAAAAQLNLAGAQEQMKAEQLSTCLHNLHIGEAGQHAYTCGSPDHTNADLRGDQLVYPDGTLVYIDKQTNTVVDVQWTHPN